MNRRVLVIDDDHRIIMTYRTILSPDEEGGSEVDELMELAGEDVSSMQQGRRSITRQNFDLYCYQQGEPAIEQLQEMAAEERPPAVALVDMRLPPGIDGLKTAVRLREIDPRIHIIIATAYSDASVTEMQSMLDYGFIFLSKPVIPEELYQAVRNGCVAWQRDRRLEQQNYELTRTLEELQQTRGELIEKEQMASIGEQVGGVAHELKTPIGNGVLASSMLEEEFRSVASSFESGSIKKSELRQFLQHGETTAHTIETNLQRASEMVESFKTVVVDQCSERIRRFDVAAYLQEVLDSIHPKTRKYSHEIRYSMEAPVEAETYPGVFSQVVINLVMNALIHGFSAGDRGKVELKLMQQNDHMRLTVEDDGKGMAADVQEHIFEPFYTTRPNEGGSGLGLHLVKDLVEHRLHGTIQCESREGEGSLFEVNIPREL